MGTDHTSSPQEAGAPQISDEQRIAKICRDHEEWAEDGCDVGVLAAALDARSIEVFQLAVALEDARRKLASREAEVRRLSSDLAEARNERWDDRDAPGGWVCATCGVPVESEPCPQHAPMPQAEVRRETLREAAIALERRAGDFKHLAGDKVRRQTHNDIAGFLRDLANREPS